VSARVLDGKWVRDQILSELRPRVAKLSANRRPPGLAVVLVGNDPASEIYVRGKIKACAELGIYSEKITPPDTISTGELLGIIEGLNLREEIDGILVQVPLPKQVDKRRILLSIRPDKDVDGFHPVNVGSLVANIPAPRACTPAGIMELLRRYEIPIAGKSAVVVGRSDIVGKPVALLLLHQSATVTICHSKTSNLQQECRRADILVIAIGKAAFVTADFIKPGATVIDVGQNRGSDGKGLVGDVDQDAMRERSSAYTPVPGGVGPLTIAMLMANTVDAAERHLCSG
jgi:methylenetetrahydrofolate dehydrogenase (NADP+)/methenyltetrahydrofolate cyclohydrolase